MKIERLLIVYANKLNNHEEIDLNYFKKQLGDEDYREFIELTEFIKLCKAVFTPPEFENIVYNINEYRRINIL